MKYPCGLVRDLLPLYIDDVCTEETGAAVEEHVGKCDDCRRLLDVMRAGENVETERKEGMEKAMEQSLKTVKHRMDKKFKRIIAGAVTAVVLVTGGFQVLFCAALKTVELEDVTVSAEVYDLNELAQNPPERELDSESVTIYADDSDESERIQVTIPELATITLTEEIVEEQKNVTVVSISSEYTLVNTKNEIVDDTMYISEFRTTLLNNKAAGNQTTSKYMELRKIERIVYVESDGSETTLWTR